MSAGVGDEASLAAGAAGRVTRGAGWVYGFRWSERLLDFFAIVALARLLAPEDFGLVAIAGSWVTIIEGLSDVDVSKALIQARDERRSLYDTAWTLALVRGVGSAALIALAAPFAADPRISAALYVLAVNPLLRGLSNPRFVMFERDLRYAQLAVVTLAAKVVGVAVTLGVAIAYRSFWALVLGAVAVQAVTTLLSFVLRPFFPRFSMRHLRDILGFSGWMTLATAVTTLSMETDRIIVGRLLGVSEAGIYYMTQRVGVLPTRELVSPLQRVLFPSFSEMTDDPARLRRAARESIGVLASLSLPAAFGFANVADLFVPLVLGEQWAGVVPLLVILVPFLGVRATLSMTLPCVMALGRTRLLFEVSLLYALVHVPVFVAGTMLYGLPGAVNAIVVAGVAYIYLNAWLLRRTLDISLREIGASVARPLIAASLMAAMLSMAARRGVAPDLSALLSLGLQVAVGIVVYGASLFALWRLAGRPPGFERRLLQLLRRSATS